MTTFVGLGEVSAEQPGPIFAPLIENDPNRLKNYQSLLGGKTGGNSTLAPVFHARIKPGTGPDVVHIIAASRAVVRVGRLLLGATVVTRDGHLQLLDGGKTRKLFLHCREFRSQYAGG